MERCTKPKVAVWNPDCPRNGPGIYDLEDIRQRCRIDDETGCWHWSGAISAGGENSRSRTPRISLPAGVLSTPGIRTLSVGRVVWLMLGRRLKAGQVVWRTCGCDDCCAPSHLKAGTKAEEGKWMRESGRRKGDLVWAAKNRKNAANQAVPDETVLRIQQMIADGMKYAEITSATGVSKWTISKIANGRHIRQREIVGLSVFSWRPAA